MLYHEVMNTALKKACDLVGASKLARWLGVTPQAINSWKKTDQLIPPIRCVQIEQATEGCVTRKDLRPNDWHLIWPELVEQVKTRRRSKD